MISITTFFYNRKPVRSCCMSRATLWHQPPFGPGHFRLQKLSFSAHEQFFLTARHTEPARKLLMTTGRCSCEGMVPGPCLSSVSESFRVDSYAVSIRSLKSYSDHIYVDLKIMFLKRNKNKIHGNLLSTPYRAETQISEVYNLQKQ